MALLTPVRRLLRGALDELFPDLLDAEATGGRGPAGAPGEPWQPDPPEVYCPRCGASAGPGAVMGRGCAHCAGQSFPWDRLTRLSAYTAPMDDWIRTMKFHRQWRRGPWLGRHLAKVTPDPLGTDRVVVCPVPMHWRRRWQRGYNQATLIAEALAKARRWPMVDLLHRARPTPPQTAIPPSQRPANVRDAITIAPVDLTGYAVVLVDDVKTTGSTLRVCARQLREAGARPIHIAVAAVADPKGQDFQVL